MLKSCDNRYNSRNKNISMKGLYFRTKPSGGMSSEIKNTISKNPYIKSLAEKEDIIASFEPKAKNGLLQHILILDVVDITKKQVKKSMWFSSRLFGKFKDISPMEFINKVCEPPKIKQPKGFWGKIFKNKQNPNQNQYFNYQEVSPHKDDLLAQKLHVNEQLKEVEQKRRNLLMTHIDEIQ